MDPARVIGVRTPDLRKLSRELAGTEQAAAFVRQLPHDYYEENNLHGLPDRFLRDYGETVAALESFLPHVDNWATCDLLHPRAFDKCRKLCRISCSAGCKAMGRTRFALRWGCS